MSDHKEAIKLAETKIQRILLDLEEETDSSIEAINVDTRLFANCRVEIFLVEALSPIVVIGTR